MRCEGHDRIDGSKSLKAADDMAFWLRTASRRLRQHLPKWVKRTFIPAFLDLPSRERTAAQMEFLAKRWGTTPEKVAEMLRDAWHNDRCPGRCELLFKDLEHGVESMQMAVKDIKRPPTMDNLFALCYVENQQMGTMSWDRLQEKWFWDDDWKEKRPMADARRPEQLGLPL